MDTERRVVEGLPVDLIWADATRRQLLALNIAPLPEPPETEAAIRLTLVRRSAEGETVIIESLFNARDLGYDDEGRPTLDFWEPIHLRPEQAIELRLTTIASG